MLKKIKNYIEENNNKLNTIKHKLDYTENERNNLLLDHNQLYGKLKGTENELYETKKRLDEARDDINKKIYIDNLKEIQEKNDYQNNEIKKNENELNEKNKIIENLKNEKNEIIKKNDEINKKYSEINKKLTEEVKELKENLIQNKKYFEYYKENKVITQEHINELNNENQKIKEELYK